MSCVFLKCTRAYSGGSMANWKLDRQADEQTYTTEEHTPRFKALESSEFYIPPTQLPSAPDTEMGCKVESSRVYAGHGANQARVEGVLPSISPPNLAQPGWLLSTSRCANSCLMRQLAAAALLCLSVVSHLVFPLSWLVVLPCPTVTEWILQMGAHRGGVHQERPGGGGGLASAQRL